MAGAWQGLGGGASGDDPMDAAGGGRWALRAARPEDAAAACRVVRDSIEQLCSADHGGDPAVLAEWLANKVPDRFAAWIRAQPAGMILAVGRDGVAGVGLVLRNGCIALNYVAPWARRQGVSRGVLRALEALAAERGDACCTLSSTETAHRFYRACGYTDTGPPAASYGGRPAFPMRRDIRAQA